VTLDATVWAVGVATEDADLVDLAEHVVDGEDAGQSTDDQDGGEPACHPGGDTPPRRPLAASGSRMLAHRSAGIQLRRQRRRRTARAAAPRRRAIGRPGN